MRKKGSVTAKNRNTDFAHEASLYLKHLKMGPGNENSFRDHTSKTLSQGWPCLDSQGPTEPEFLFAVYHLAISADTEVLYCTSSLSDS